MKNLLSVLAIFAIAGLAVAPANAKTAGKTKVVMYSAAGMKVTGKPVKGYCWTESLAVMRTDAFRCMIGNNIMDPCFMTSNKTVNCPENMDKNSGVTIALTKPLPKNMSKKSGNPWRFMLAGGVVCNAGTGTVIANYPYYCSGNLVCAVPNANAKMPAIYVAQCGKPTGPMSVKGAKPYAVVTLWQ